MKNGKRMLALLLALVLSLGLFGCADKKAPAKDAGDAEEMKEIPDTEPETETKASVDEPETVPAAGDTAAEDPVGISAEAQPGGVPGLLEGPEAEKLEAGESKGELIPLPVGWEEIPSEMKVCRIDGYNSSIFYPQVIVLRSVEELEAHLEAYKTVFGFEDGNGAAYAAEWRARYDEAYFAEKKLIVLLLEEGSGSVMICPEGIYGDAVTAELRITLQVPPVGTADMAEYHVLFEVAKDVTENLTPELTTEYPPEEFRYKWNDYGFLLRYPADMQAEKVYYSEDPHANAWSESNGEWGGIRLYFSDSKEKGYAEFGFFPNGAPVPAGACKVSKVTTENGLEVTVYTPEESGNWGMFLYTDGTRCYAGYNHGLRGKGANTVLSALLSFVTQ